MSHLARPYRLAVALLLTCAILAASLLGNVAPKQAESIAVLCHIPGQTGGQVGIGLPCTGPNS